MLESVPAYVETLIYGYFLTVGTVGLYVSTKIWLTGRTEG